jgi:hypothetical protein
VRLPRHPFVLCSPRAPGARGTRRASRFALASLSLLLVALLALAGAGCVSKPTMKLNHAEISGVKLAFPLNVSVLMTVYIDVSNPNSYDVAMRSVSGQTLIAGRHLVPVDFKPGGDGVWLASKQTTQVAVPVTIPVKVGLAVLGEAAGSPSVPYRFTGKANVTATRTFQIEKDDYSIDEQGQISRQQLEAALPRL